MKPWHYIVIGLAAVILIFTLWTIFGSRQTIAPTVNEVNRHTDQNTNTALFDDTNDNPLTDASFFTTADLPDRDPALNFTASLPAEWIVEYRPASKAINFYDPRSAAATTREKSQVFVTYYQADDFDGSAEASMTARQDLTVDGHPARSYRIAATAAPDTADQPGWLASEHAVTEVKTANLGTGVIYVFSAQPELASQTWDDFIAALKIVSLE